MKDQTRHDDTKLLLTIAAVIVTGAAGIAMIAGIDGEDMPVEPRKVVRAPRPVAPIVPSVVATDTRPVPDSSEFVLAANRTQPAESTVLEPAEDAAIADDSQEGQPSDSFAPGENLVAGGLKAWESRDFPRAAAYFQAQVDARDTDAWSWYMVGLARWKNGEPAAAAAAMRNSADRDPQSVKARVNLARIENDLGNYDAALSAIDEALDLFADHPEALFVRGRTLYNSGRIDDAVTALEASVAGDPGNGYAHNLLGLIAIDRESFDAAVDALETAAGLEPNVAYIQNNLGMALERVAERSAAIAAYRRAVELDPRHPKAASNLARLSPATRGTESPVIQADDGSASTTVTAVDDTANPLPDQESVVVESAPTEIADAGSPGGKQ